MPLWEAQESGEYRTPVTAPGADGRAPSWHSDPSDVSYTALLCVTLSKSSHFTQALVSSPAQRGS